MKKLTTKEAEDLMKKYLKKFPEKIKHSILVSKFACKVAGKIKKKHPELRIDLDEIKILGLLHDIGRGVSKRWLTHAFEGERLLKELGHNYYADKIKTHDPTHEIAFHFKIKGDFIPKTIEEKILAYADLHYKSDRKVTHEERERIGLADVKREHPELLPLFMKFNKRKRKLVKEIEKLMN